MNPETLKARLKNAGVVKDDPYESPEICYPPYYVGDIRESRASISIEPASNVLGTVFGWMVFILVSVIIYGATTSESYINSTCRDFDGNIVYQYSGLTDDKPRYDYLDNNMVRLPDGKVYQATCDNKRYRK